MLGIVARGAAALGSGLEVGGPLSRTHVCVHMCTLTLQPTPRWVSSGAFTFL